MKVDSSLSNADPETPLGELARVAKAEHRIEECLQRGKSEAGLADYEGRNWTGWQQQQTLSLLATSFLVRETERGKKWTPAITMPQIRQGIALILYEALQCGTGAHMLQALHAEFTAEMATLATHVPMLARLPDVLATTLRVPDYLEAPADDTRESQILSHGDGTGVHGPHASPAPPLRVVGRPW